jgi:hypothetical protein
MSTLHRAPTTTTLPAAPRARHVLSGLALAAAGCCIVIGHALTVDPNTPTEKYIATLGAHHLSGTIGGLLTAVGAFLLLPGIAGLLGLVGRSRLATLSAGLWGLGACALGAGDVMITLVMSALVPGHAQTARSMMAVAENSGVLGLPFLLAPALILGGVLMGVALWRSRTVPGWLAALLCVGQVLIGASSGGGLLTAAMPLLPMGVALVLLGRRVISGRPPGGAA